MKKIFLLVAVLVAATFIIMSFTDSHSFTGTSDSDLAEYERLVKSIESSIEDYEGIISGSFNKRINEHLETGAWDSAQQMIQQKYYRLMDLETTRQELLQNATAGYVELANQKEEGLY